MTEIEKLKNVLERIKETKSSAVQQHNFELSAIIRDRENVLLEKIAEFTLEAEQIIDYANLHFNSTK